MAQLTDIEKLRARGNCKVIQGHGYKFAAEIYTIGPIYKGVFYVTQDQPQCIWVDKQQIPAIPPRKLVKTVNRYSLSHTKIKAKMNELYSDYKILAEMGAVIL